MLTRKKAKCNFIRAINYNLNFWCTFHCPIRMKIKLKPTIHSYRLTQTPPTKIGWKIYIIMKLYVAWTLFFLRDWWTTPTGKLFVGYGISCTLSIFKRFICGWISVTAMTYNHMAVSHWVACFPHHRTMAILEFYRAFPIYAWVHASLFKRIRVDLSRFEGILTSKSIYTRADIHSGESRMKLVGFQA
jgi:hypothetical protein